MTQRVVLKLHPDDNVLIALRDLRQGETVEVSGHRLALASDVPAKHKFVTETLSPGDTVRMYGVVVGKAASNIEKGVVLTTRNLRHEASPYRERSAEYRWTAPDVSRWRGGT